MKFYPQVAQQASTTLFSLCGPLDDLPAELRNSLANVFYRWHLFQGDFSPFAPGTAHDAFEKSVAARARSLGEFQTTVPYLKALRYAREQDPLLFRYMVRMGIDDYTFGISNVTKKSPARRAIERLFKKSSDIPGLYDFLVRLAGQDLRTYAT